MTAELNIVNAFTNQGSGGNPAAVVLNAERFTQEQKRLIAARAGLSETAFVSASSVADFKLEFFTPTRQIPHCGHATIATFYYLNQLGKTDNKAMVVKETIDGNREIHFKNGLVYMQQKAPVFTDPVAEDITKIFASLGLDVGHMPLPKIVNTGNSFMIIQVATEDALANLTPDFAAIAQLSNKYNLTGFYVFTAAKGNTDVTTRMFAPSYGINEESATGMAAGTLGPYLYHFVKQQGTYIIEQGKFMAEPSPSLIRVDLELKDGKIESVFAGGKAALSNIILIDI
jgi:PhzF family phenazine biosynthesis protein